MWRICLSCSIASGNIWNIWRKYLSNSYLLGDELFRIEILSVKYDLIIMRLQLICQWNGNICFLVLWCLPKTLNFQIYAILAIYCIHSNYIAKVSLIRKATKTFSLEKCATGTKKTMYKKTPFLTTWLSIDSTMSSGL